MITAQTRRDVFERQGGKCFHPSCEKYFNIHEPQGSPFAGQLHHIYFKSHYKKSDRDESWNLVLLCPKHHEGHDIEGTHPGEGVHNGNTQFRRYLEGIADEWKPPECRSKETIAKQYKKKTAKIDRKPVPIEQKKANRLAQKTIRDKSLERYKSKHNGMSPRQVNYKKQKEYIKNKKLLSI